MPLLRFISKSEFELKNTGLTTFLNPYSYLVARKLKANIREFDSIYCDGIILTLFIRAINPNAKRLSFDMTSLAPIVFEDCVKNNKSIFFIGGLPGTAEKAVSAIIEKYPLIVAGTLSGHFGSESDARSAMQEIVSLAPDVVVCGMGTPLQENFLLSLKETGWTGCGYTCGGFLHQTAKKGTSYYPRLINTLHLRWAYRIYDEPKLLSRYILEYPKFFFYAILDLIKYFNTADNRDHTEN